MRLYPSSFFIQLSKMYCTSTRFIKLSRDYELEQTNLTNIVETLRQEIKKQEQQKVNIRQFIAAVRKYTDMQQLTASVLREFIDHIEVSQMDKQTKTRKIKIVYNFIGAFDFEHAMTKTKTAKTEKNGIAV